MTEWYSKILNKKTLAEYYVNGLEWGKHVKILRWKYQSDKVAGKENRLSDSLNTASQIKLNTRYKIRYKMGWKYAEVAYIKTSTHYLNYVGFFKWLFLLLVFQSFVKLLFGTT